MMAGTSVRSLPQGVICYYEYGNALFRATRLQENDKETEETSADARGKAGQAAQKRAEENVNSKPAAKGANDVKQLTEESVDTKPDAKETNDDNKDQKTPSDGKEGDDNDDDDDDDEDGRGGDDDEDDIQLALEMMETAWSIVDKHIHDLKDKDESPSQWISNQLPRMLLGIGDVLSDWERHADAADVKTRALEHRENARKGIPKEELTISHLTRRRCIVEANILVAEALLECPEGKDVVATETEDVLVTAAERVDYARGYYDKGRDELQETVYLMARIAESNQNLGTEKEDVCFLATLLMGVGTTLAEYDERRSSAAALNELHPSKRQKK
jgi:hypothetical protein